VPGIYETLGTLASNPVFAGVAGGAGMGALLYQLRALPARLSAWLKRSFTVSIVIDNADGVFERLAIYLGRSDYSRRARRLRIAEIYDVELQTMRWEPSFGIGWHFLRDEGGWFALHRSVSDSDAGDTLKRRETIEIITPGRNQALIRRLIERAEQVNQRQDTVRVYMWHSGCYMLADERPVRPLSSVFIPAAQMRTLVDDMTRFKASRDLYRQRGTPHRRGYLLEGPPGTGKSSLAFALACVSGRAVHIINLSTCGGDTGLLAAFNYAGSSAFIVIEDIDTARVSHSRDEKKEEIAVKSEGVTLSGLLNAIDGMGARDGRILVITTNRPDVLDPALIRPGRIDRRETIGLLEADEARAMVRHFLGDTEQEWFAANVAAKLPLAAATLQEMLLQEGADFG
jgi:hypothetical protein